MTFTTIVGDLMWLGSTRLSGENSFGGVLNIADGRQVRELLKKSLEAGVPEILVPGAPEVTIVGLKGRYDSLNVVAKDIGADPQRIDIIKALGLDEKFEFGKPQTMDAMVLYRYLGKLTLCVTFSNKHLFIEVFDVKTGVKDPKPVLRMQIRNDDYLMETERDANSLRDILWGVIVYRLGALSDTHHSFNLDYALDHVDPVHREKIKALYEQVLEQEEKEEDLARETAALRSTVKFQANP